MCRILLVFAFWWLVTASACMAQQYTLTKSETLMTDAAWHMVHGRLSDADTCVRGAVADCLTRSAGKPPGANENVQLSVALYRLGESQFKANKLTEATSSLLKSIEKNPCNDLSMSALIKVYQRQGKTLDAAKIERLKNDDEHRYAHLDWAAYMSNLQTAIKTHWHPPSEKTSKHATTQFVIRRDGQLQAIIIEKSSGERAVDAAAIRAVVAAAPFEKFPSGGPPNVAMLFDFDFNVDQIDPKKEEEALRDQVIQAKKDHDANNPIVALKLCELASVYSEHKKFDEAEKTALEAMNIVKDNPVAQKTKLSVVCTLATICIDAGQSERAEGYVNRALKDGESLSVSDKMSLSSELQQLCHRYGKFLYQQNKAAEGDKMFAKEALLRKQAH